MAVIKNKQTISSVQYENIFAKLMRHTHTKMRSIPKRRWRYVGKPILDVMNQAYIPMMGMSFWTVRGDPQFMLVKYNATKQAIHDLLKIQKPLYVYWSICGDASKDIKYQDDDQRGYWVEMINSEINLLLGVLRKNPHFDSADDLPNNPIRFYTNREVGKSVLLTELRTLHRYIHTRACRANRLMTDGDMAIVVYLADDAWYHALEGNRNIPSTKDEYLARRAHFSRMIADLESMNRPLTSIFSTDDLSEHLIAEWSHMLNETIKLCYRVQDSDKKRFGNLK